MSNPTPAAVPLRLQELHKSYQERSVLRGVSLAVEQGEIVALLGRNGCGKSTLIRMGLGLGKPCQGVVHLFGQAPQSQDRRVLSQVGVAFDELGMYPDLSVIENLLLHAGLHGIPRDQARPRAMQLLERFALAGHAQVRPSELSRGMSKKAGIARALLHAPEFLILDEPFSGLDPEATRELADLLVQLRNERELSMLVTSHRLEIIQRIASRVVMMHEGQVVLNRPTVEFGAKQSLEEVFHALTNP